MMALKGKRKTLRPLYAGHIYQIGKKVNSLKENETIGEFFKSETWTTFDRDLLVDTIKDHEFLLGGVDPNKRVSINELDNMMEDLNDVNSNAESNESDPWSFGNGINFNEYFDDDVDDDTDLNNLNLGTGMGNTQTFQIMFTDTETEPVDSKYSKNTIYTTDSKNDDLDDLMSELGI